MSTIKIEDLPESRELTDTELDKVAGGYLLGFTQPTMFLAPSLYGSYSISTIPLPGVTVAGVRG